MKITEGSKLGRYEIRSLIGVGGMGEVYLAEDSDLGRQVALKVLLADIARDEERVRRFVQEAKAASALNHPNILTVYEIGTFEESRFIATELIKGEMLRDRLRGEPMTLREVLDVAMQSAAALNAAHSAGIVHRDIKPENIMLRDDGIVKVLDFGLAKRSQIPHATGSANVGTAQFSEHSTAIHSGVISTQNSMPQQQSSAEYLVSQVKQHKFGALLIVTVAMFVVAGIGFGIYKLAGSKKTDISFEAAKLTRVTSTGKATHASISPDGKYIVHVVADAGKESLWVRQTATGSNVQIVPPAEVGYWGMTFSRDGDYVYYVTREVGKGVGFLYRVPVLGGTPDSVVRDVDSIITISPDGSQMAFFRWDPFDKSGGLWIGNIDGTSARKVAKRSNPETLTGAPAWSPDGRTVACPFGGIDAGTAFNGILSVRVNDGEQKLFTPKRWGAVGRINWVDNNGIILNASEQGADKTMQLWYVSSADGEARSLTHDLNSYGDIALSADSNTLVTVQQGMQSNLFVIQTDEEEHPRQLTTGKGADGYNVSWTPDGKILYDSSVGSGRAEICVIKPDGSEARRLTADQFFDQGPLATSDGRYLIFASNPSGVRHIWRMGSDGRNTVQLTSGDSPDTSTALSPDGQWIFFSRGNTPGILKVSINGGEPAQLGQDLDGRISAVAPDGQTIAYWNYEGDGQAVKIISAVDGSGLKSLNPPPTAAFLAAALSYSADGRSIKYLDTRDGISNIWSQPLDGSQPKQVTKFTDGNIFCFAYSPDGKQLAYTKGSVTNDVVLVSGFKK